MKQCGLTLLPIEQVAAVYGAVTSLLMLVLWPRLVDPLMMLVTRLEWLAATAVLVGLSYLVGRRPSAATGSSLASPRATWLSPLSVLSLLRAIVQTAFLILWYPDTYEFNRSFDNLDHHFAALDLQLFGSQPSLEFSRLLSSSFWSEAFNLGYWSYYPMIALLALAVLFKWRDTSRSSRFSHVTSVIMAAFFLYYLIYIFVPVAGPQFYFEAVGVDAIAQGHFPSLGTYFSSHTEMLPAPGDSSGLFYNLVSGAQATGERPTAAFPSSHIGISTIVLLLAYRHVPRLLIVLLPLWGLLCCATVYIQAHYLVDAIAGLASAPLMLWLAQWMVRPLFGIDAQQDG